MRRPSSPGFAVYLVPLMIGARDMAYPRLNSFTYWSYLFSGIFLYIAPADRASTACGLVLVHALYRTSVYSPTHGMDFYALSLIILTISTTGRRINFIVTILRLRAPGMAISKMPLFLYSTLTISCVILFAMPALTIACVFLELDRRWGMHFFDVPAAAIRMLWQQLFWFFGHPWVYVIFLPATGMISLIIPGLLPPPYRRLSLCRHVHNPDRGGRLQRVAAPHVHGGHVGSGHELLQRRQHDDLDVYHRSGLRLGGDRMEGPSGRNDVDVCMLSAPWLCWSLAD